MPITSVGKIEEETQLTDLEQLENQLEAEIEDGVNNDNKPLPQQLQLSPFAPVGAKGKSKFAASPRMRSAFFPGQVTGLSAKLGEPQPLVPLTYAEKRAKMKPANDSSPFVTSKFAAAKPAGGVVRKTLGTLIALGAVPVKFLEDLGFFRYVKERQFNSALRLEMSLGQGHENAEQFLRHHPRASKKKAPAVPPVS